jgi:hypothetical protein
MSLTTGGHTMNNTVEPRIQKFAAPLVIGGTPADDAIMDLVAISEMAEDDPEALRVMNELADLISAELVWLKKRRG